MEDYLAFEQASDFRHEFVAGQIFAMVGARDAHTQVAGNLYARLRQHLRGSGCRVFISDMKLRVEPADAFYYPDVFVTCDPRDTEPYYKRYPSLVIEVLSPTTEGVDRREKLRNYRMLETLREYVLVSLDERRLEIFRREPTGDWTVDTLAEDEPVELASVGLTLPMAEIYEDVARQPIM
jgi:Uma2 family endonuclease